MADGVLEFGYDDSAVRAGLANLERQTKATKARVDKQTTINPKVAGGGALRGIGNASLQVQDIAVQMQAGTKFSTIFAQQAPQLLSAFGPAGMIVGGVAAIGGAFYSASVAASEAFNEMIQGAQLTQAELQKLAQSGDIAAMARGIEESAKGLKSMVEEAQKLEKTGIWDGAKLGAGMILGNNGSQAEMQAKLNEVMLQQLQSQLAVEDSMVQESAKQLAITELIAQGRETEAGVASAQLALEREIASIRASALTSATKEALITNARLATMQKIAQVNEIDAKKKEQEQNKQLQVQESRENILLNLAALEAQSKGQQGLAEGLRQELSVRSRINQLKSEGLNDQQARAIAEKEVELQGQASGEVGGRIKGANAAKRAEALGNLQASGLDEFVRLQAGGVYERRNGAFGRDKSLSEMVRPGGPMGQLARESNRRNAARQGREQIKLEQTEVERLLRSIDQKFNILP